MRKVFGPVLLRILAVSVRRVNAIIRKSVSGRLAHFLPGACLLLATGISQPAAALGLGQIRVMSALGQPFVASLPVSRAADEEPACVAVRNDASQPLPGLTGARVAVVESGGTTRIEITTRVAVMEPLVQFVIAAGCGASITRSYTVFLDPPRDRPIEQMAESLPAVSVVPAPASVETSPAPSSRLPALQRPEALVAPPATERPPAAARSAPARQLRARTTPARAPQSRPTRPERDRVQLSRDLEIDPRINPRTGRPINPALAVEPLRTERDQLLAQLERANLATQIAERELVLQRQVLELTQQNEAMRLQIEALKALTAAPGLQAKGATNLVVAPWLEWVLGGLTALALLIALWFALRRRAEPARETTPRWWSESVSDAAWVPPSAVPSAAAATAGGVAGGLTGRARATESLPVVPLAEVAEPKVDVSFAEEVRHEDALHLFQPAARTPEVVAAGGGEPVVAPILPVTTGEGAARESDPGVPHGTPLVVQPADSAGLKGEVAASRPLAPLEFESHLFAPAEAPVKLASVAQASEAKTFEAKASEAKASEAHPEGDRPNAAPDWQIGSGVSNEQLMDLSLLPFERLDTVDPQAATQAESIPLPPLAEAGSGELDTNAALHARLSQFWAINAQVEAMIEAGDEARAIALLRRYVLRDENIPALMWLQLFDLYRRVDKKPVYEALADHFARRYERPMIAWDAQLSSKTPQIGLAALPELAASLRLTWGTSRGLAAVNRMLCGHRETDAVVFNAVLQRDLLDFAKTFPPALDAT